VENHLSELHLEEEFSRVQFRRESSRHYNSVKEDLL
jgi:hypothetical protein